jgi:hypothetical protein
MIQRLETSEFLFILDTEIEWDGVGYPTQSRKVWQCPLDNAQELPLYEAKYLELQAEWDAMELARVEAEALALVSEQKKEAERLAMIQNL